MITRYRLYDHKQRMTVGIFEDLEDVREKISELTGYKVSTRYRGNGETSYQSRFRAYVVRSKGGVDDGRKSS